MGGRGRWLRAVVVGGVVAAVGCGSSTNSSGSGGSGGLHGLGGRGGAGGVGTSLGGRTGAGGGAGASSPHDGGPSGGTAGGAGEATGGGGAGGGSGGPGGAGPGGASTGVGGAGVGGAGVGGSMGGSSGSGCLVPSTPGAWTEIGARPGDSGLTITDSFALAGDELLFAGTTSPGASGNQLRVVHWSHGCWSEELSMPIDMTATHASVHGLGAGDLWAVGGDLILHETGLGWTPFDDGWRSKIQLTPRKFNAPALPTWCASARPAASDVWFNEVENIVHWTAGSWTAYNFDSPNYPDSTPSRSTSPTSGSTARTTSGSRMAAMSSATLTIRRTCASSTARAGRLHAAVFDLFASGGPARRCGWRPSSSRRKDFAAKARSSPSPGSARHRPCLFHPRAVNQHARPPDDVGKGRRRHLVRRQRRRAFRRHQLELADRHPFGRALGDRRRNEHLRGRRPERRLAGDAGAALLPQIVRSLTLREAPSDSSGDRVDEVADVVRGLVHGQGDAETTVAFRHRREDGGVGVEAVAHQIGRPSGRSPRCRPS